MIVTTTTSVENRTITSYEGIVFGEVITGINVLKDIGAGLRCGRRREDGLRSSRLRQRDADGYVQRNRGKIEIKNSGSALLSCASSFMKAAFERILRAYFKNRRFVRNLALSRTPESRQNPKEMPHFCLPDSPNAARTAPKVDKNPEKSEK